MLFRSEPSPPLDSTSRRRRHRPKVRSRQKNIYKDKRTWDQKPSHLIPGTSEFGGRPLTAETRLKLVDTPTAPTSRSGIPLRNTRTSLRHHHDNPIGSTTYGTRQEHRGDGGLAIDDLLADDYDTKALVAPAVNHPNHASVSLSRAKLTKQGKKRKQPKYKNLIL